VELNGLGRVVGFWAALLFLSGAVSAETLTGSDAIKAVIGKPVIVETDSGILFYNFESVFDFRLKRPAPYNDEIKGKVSRGSGSSIVCLSYGGIIKATCVQIEFNDTRLVMTESNGYQTIGVVMTGSSPKQKQAVKAVEKGEPEICVRLLSIANSALKTDSFDRLINEDVAPITSLDQGSAEIYTSKVRLGECLIDTSVNLPRHNCMIPMPENDPKSMALYSKMNKQVQLCLGDKITEAKPVSKIVVNSVQQETAVSNYKLGNSLNLSVKLGPLGRCLDLVYDGCDDEYGVYIDAWIAH
jgi:hypothetical protein